MAKELLQRHRVILTEARRVGAVTVDELAIALGRTPQTIRRDLNLLCDAGHLNRTHGGAELPGGLVNVGYAERGRIAFKEKEAIGRAVAAIIPDRASILINVGTTTEEVARALVQRSGLLVITNNLNVADILAQSDIEVVVAGGRLRPSDRATVGPFATEFIRNFKVDIAIIGTSAIDSDGTLLDFDVNEVEVARAIIASARSVILASNSSKLNRSAPIRIASISEIDHFVTDRLEDDGFRALCEREGVNLVEAAATTDTPQKTKK